ncbi:MAG: EamA/RhaT family transporter, partial [Actinobacteria bacterium]|nr:EamA/RhaT family transporter [Actinomycetota bacterium]
MPESSVRNRRFATALLVFITAIWGFTFVTNQEVLKSISPTDLLAWRFCIAALVMLAIKPRCIARLTREQQKQGVILGL